MARLSDENGGEIQTTHAIAMTRHAHRRSTSALRKTKKLHEESFVESSMTKTTTQMSNPIGGDANINKWEIKYSIGLDPTLDREKSTSKAIR
ncbi:hypothetical protein CFP56_039450 [Quercus suber]|uniref:Uncharacterized protein n=1 Tax=Quercus suber TaxID=58331 RepID=A0AAW0IZX9_QUESU